MRGSAADSISDLRGVGWAFGAAATGFSEGLIPLAKDGKFGYMDRTGKIIADFQFKEAQDFNGTVASVMLSSGKSALLGTDGKIIWQEK